MSKKFFTDIDLRNNQLLQAVLENRSSYPAGPDQGNIFYHTTIDRAVYYAGVGQGSGAYGAPDGWIVVDDSIIGLTEGLAINITDLNGVYTISVVPGSILHSALNNDELTGNPHNVTLTEAMASGNSAGGLRVISLAAGTDPNDAVNKSQLDAASSGLKWKDPVTAATIAPITLSGPGASIDDVTLLIDNRVLVKNQVSLPENGLYLWKGAASAMVRTTDMDQAGEFINSAVVVLDGTVNAGIGYTQTEVVGTPGADDVIWVQFSGASLTAGDGLYRSGTVFNVGKTALGGIQVNTDDIAVQASEVAGLGLEVGSNQHKLAVKVTDNSVKIATTSVAVNEGGVQAKHINIDVAGDGLEGGDSVGGSTPTPLSVKPYSSVTATLAPVTVNLNGVAVEVDNTTIKHTNGQLHADFTGVGNVDVYSVSTTLSADSAKTITHGLGTDFVQVTVYNAGEIIELDINRVDSNNIQITSSEALSVDVVVLG